MMADNLNLFGREYLGVVGFKATDDNENILTFYHATNGDLLAYGLTDGTLPLVGVAQVGSVEI